MNKQRSLLILLLSLCSLAACGTRGALVLPPGQPTPPLLGAGHADAGKDVSTPKESPR